MIMTILRDYRGNFSIADKIVTKNNNIKEERKLENRERVKKYYRDHPEKKKEHYEYVKLWRKNNPDKVKAQHEKWRENNYEKWLEICRNNNRKRRERRNSK